MLRVILILLSVFILTDHSGSAITSHRVQEQLINCKGYYILFLSQYIILLETVKNIKTVEIIIGVIVIIFPILFNLFFARTFCNEMQCKSVTPQMIFTC